MGNVALSLAARTLSAHLLDEAEIRQQADTYLERLQHYPAWPGGRHAATSTTPTVPDDARPASR